MDLELHVVLHDQSMATGFTQTFRSNCAHPHAVWNFQKQVKLAVGGGVIKWQPIYTNTWQLCAPELMLRSVYES